MGLKRYLLFLSYSGTYFRGAQRQRSRAAEFNDDPETVQGLLEFAISRLNPNNTVIVTCSSRTDQGVHAIKTSACVDLDFTYDLQCKQIHYFLNKFFDTTNLDIRIIDVLHVKDDFLLRRSVVWRKYLYRLAVLKSGYSDKTVPEYLLPISAVDYRRCHYISNVKFDVEAIKEASKLFVGTKDFLVFVSKPKRLPEEISTVKTITHLGIEPAFPPMDSPYSDLYDYWNITCQGRSFLYKQVRRIVGSLTALAQGIIVISDIRKMLDEPLPKNWPSTVLTAPSHGLYLMEVAYDPKDLEAPTPVATAENHPALERIERLKAKREFRERVLYLKKLKINVDQ